MSKYQYDTTGNKIGVILVHGYVHDDINDRIRDVIGDNYFTTVCYLDGGYTLTLAATQEIDEDTAMEMIGEIYNHEDDIPNTCDEDAPVFVGIQNEPVIISNSDGEYVMDFLGGIWGYEEDSLDLYQE